MNKIFFLCTSISDLLAAGAWAGVFVWPVSSSFRADNESTPEKGNAATEIWSRATVDWQTRLNSDQEQRQAGGHFLHQVKR